MFGRLAIVSTLLALTAGGCGGELIYPAAARQDLIDCKNQIDNDDSYGIGPLAQLLRNGDYEDCMRMRGWKPVRKS